MKKVLFTFYAIMLCCIYANATGEFKFKNLYYICTSDTTAKLYWGKVSGEVIIPDTVIRQGVKYAVTEIDTSALAVHGNYTMIPDDQKITSVVIPATVKIIRAYAFSGQTDITDIYFLGGNITFESSVFALSNFISRKVHINSFEEWCNNKYPQSDNRGVSTANPLYGAYIYINGEQVQNVHLSSNVKTISANAFEGVLNSIVLTCDTGLVSIGDYAFMNSKIKDIEFPSSLKSIGQYAFRQCPIHNLVIPENVSSIGSYAFDYNSSFHKIVWKAKNLHCQRNTPAYAAFSVTSGNLDTLIVDTGVVSLPEYMFYSTIYAVKPVIISYNKNVPYAYQNTFNAVNKKSPLYVPKGKRTAYMSGWGFSNVYEMEEEEETALEILDNTSHVHTKKIFHNGQIYIVRGDKTYTMTGTEVK